MPSGYTGLLVEKKLSFKQFALLCTRAFGVAISLRDDPIEKPLPEKLESDGYFLNRIKESTEELSNLLSMNEEESIKWAKEKIDSQVSYYEKSLNDPSKIEAENIYKKTLQEAKDWIPPTKDHEGLKTFLISQIEESMKYDHNDTYLKEALEEAKKQKPLKYYKKAIERLNKDIKYFKEEWDKEQKRIATNNKWLADLRESLNGY